MKTQISIKPKGILPDKKKKALTKNQVVLITIAGAMVISALAYFLFVSPQRARLKSGGDLDTQQLDRQIEQQQSSLNDLNTLLNNYQRIDQSDIELVSRLLPNSKQIPELLSQVEAMGRESGVTVTSVNVVEVQENQKGSVKQRVEDSQTAKKDMMLQELQVDVEFNAYSYAAYKNFINNLQSHARIIDIQSFTYDESEDVQRLTFKTYYLGK